MSNMLEQAIVDAQTLREAALKNAQAAIVEKYSDEVKNAVSRLLEEEPLDGAEEPTEEDSVMADIPMAHVAGEPNSDEEIELCSYPSSGGVQVQEDLTHLAFEVESLVEFEKHIQSLGVEYSDGPHLKEAGGGFAFIDAPEGYEIELIEKAPDSSGY